MRTNILRADSNKVQKEDIKPKKGALRENIEAIIIAVILALFIRTFIIQAFKIPSGSMKSTLLVGDHILVNKFIYGVKIPFIDYELIKFKEPKRGDIIVFKFPEDIKKDFIKRVIGVSGDVIEIKDKQLYINNKKPDVAYGQYTDSRIFPKEVQPRDNLGPIIIPAGSLFVLGDNRDHSYDSRFWGFVKLSAVRGQAFIIYWSWNSEDANSVFDYVRWKRIGQLIK